MGDNLSVKGHSCLLLRSLRADPSLVEICGVEIIYLKFQFPYIMQENLLWCSLFKKKVCTQPLFWFSWSSIFLLVQLKGSAFVPSFCSYLRNKFSSQINKVFIRWRKRRGQHERTFSTYRCGYIADRISMGRKKGETPTEDGRINQRGMASRSELPLLWRFTLTMSWW